MADSEEWFVGEDGCLSVGQPANSVTYHSSLNTILVSTKESSVKVLDVTSGSVLQTSNLSAHKSEQVECVYLPQKDKILFCDGCCVGVRKDLNGMLLLDTALQTPVNTAEDIIRVELPLPEASHLFKTLMHTELPVTDYVEDVLRELEKEIEAAQQATKGSHKVAKWATVCLNLPHSALKTVCGNLVTELKRLNQHVPGLTVASAVYDRLAYLLPSSLSDYGNGLVDRALMYSEASRRETFSKWPHMNYKWALPDPMAQAGFYHQPSTTGDDRAMCFTCNVCLVCWEPTDEPWSEHERHSPSCAFVKGEYTQNVPLSVTYATEPACYHGNKNDKIECISNTSSEEYVATSTHHGNVVVWNMNRQLKKHIQFNIDPWDPVIAMKTGTQVSAKCEEVSPGDGKPVVKEAWTETTSPTNSNPAESIPTTEDNESKAEIIDVGGAWRQGQTEASEIVDIPLDDLEIIRESIQRSRPSQDVVVSSLCMLGIPENGGLQQASSASASADIQVGKLKPCLVSGVAIRKNTLYSASDFRRRVVAMMGDSDKDDVAAMNQVNQALSGSATPQIIPDSPSSQDGILGETETNPFVPYLLVHDVSSSHIKDKRTKEKENKVSQQISHSVGGIKGGSTSMSGLQDLYMPQIIEMDEDPDVQIIGVTPPPLEMQNSMPKFGFTISTGSPSTTPKYMMTSISSSKDTSSVTSSNSANTKELVDTGSSPQSIIPLHKDGQVVQCIQLPDYITCDHYVKSLVPSVDGRFLIVVIVPRRLKEDRQDSSTQFLLDSSEDSDRFSGTQNDSSTYDKGNKSSSGGDVVDCSGGCILVYKLKLESNIVVIDDKPVKMLQISNMEDSVTSLLTLPLEVTSIQEDDEIISAQDMGRSHIDTRLDKNNTVLGQIAVTTWSGCVKIINLDDMKLLSEVPSPDDDDKFVSLTFCSGLDRLCACTDNGKLHFYIISPRQPDFSEREMLQHSSPLRPGSWNKDTDLMDGPIVDNWGRQDIGEDLLVKQPLSTEVLTALHELTQFENLMPRFSATAPPCWTEIQQEQQQRRHPQHLQQRGEATRHTRTWRLQQDSTSWDEHLFELVLPRPCSIGHVDVKFSLHPLCTSAPTIQVTLLKQNISNIGRQTSIEVDTKIDFNMKPTEDNNDGANSPKSSSNGPVKAVNNVMDPAFLERHGAEILCGPVDMSNCIDLSGHSGLVTLTSPQLLKVKSRSLLVHIKALPSEKRKKYRLRL